MGKLTEKQKSVLDYLNTVESANISDIYKNTKLNYYHNWSKHTGELLSGMVKSGLLVRKSRGLYAINNKQRLIENNENQISLEI